MEQQTLRQFPDLSAITKCELFSTLLEHEADFIAEHSEILHVRKKTRLFSAGQKASRFYLLAEGSVRVYKSLDNRGSEEIARYAPGDTIGDFDFARKAQYDADAEAAEDSLLIVFPAGGLVLENFTGEAPGIVSRILLNSIVMMTGRIKSAQKLLLENLSWVNELHRRAYEDPGTGLWKQSFLTDEIDHILEKPTALIMLKPERFKILVDSRGHGVGDEAMVRIAMILKNLTRRAGRGWPLRFKSNETGILLNKCVSAVTETVAAELSRAVASMEPVPAAAGIPEFSFSGTVVWTVWPEDCGDGADWGRLFSGCYALLLETWKRGGNQIVHYTGDAQ